MRLFLRPILGIGIFAAFFLFTDEGGIPPANKIKVKPEHGQEIKLMTTEIGHQLKEGDQVILGESALLEFSYSANS